MSVKLPTTKTQIQTPTVSFVERYPEFAKMADEQLKVLWFWDEIKVEKDVQDILVNMTEAERHGVITVLRLFTLYERMAGSEFWGGVMLKRYPRPEINRMCAVFSAIELGVHQPFYTELNELLNLNTDEFYLSYVDDEVLKDRIDFIDEMIGKQHPLISTAAFSMVEGVVLYSSFAFLKHFQSNGKNKLLNLNRGISFSAIDENLHAIGGAAIFKRHLEELDLNEEQQVYLHDTLKGVAEKILEHELRIIDMVFEKGDIQGVTKVQLKHFVESRINLCMRNLGYNNMYKVSYNPIGDWFYKGINNYQFVDFFSGMGKEYQRDWDEEAFGWVTEEKEVVA